MYLSIDWFWSVKLKNEKLKMKKLEKLHAAI